MAKRILNVPYYSQWDADGSDNQNDCGPASLKMVLAYFSKILTIDELNKKAGSGTGYTSWTQMQKAAKEVGFTSSLLRKNTKQSLIKSIDEGYPCIVVLHYGDLKGRQDDFTGPHILVVTGYDDKGYYVNDPNYWGSRREEGKSKFHDNASFEKAWGSTVDGNQPFTIMKVAGKVPVPEKTTPSPTPKFDVNADLSSEIEADAGLKNYGWYNKKWSFVDLVEFTDTIYRTRREALATLEQVREQSVEELVKLNEAIRDKNKEINNLKSQLVEKDMAQTSPTLEAGKELLRLALFAGIGFAISYVGDLPQTETTAIVLAVLRFVDKYIHENKNIDFKGISPF